MSKTENRQRSRAEPSEADYPQALRAELERRIAVLATTSDDTFGRMGAGDAILVVALCVLAPALVIWLCR